MAALPALQGQPFNRHRERDVSCDELRALKAIHKSIKLLRDDAIERGMVDLSIEYGWCQMSLGEQILRLLAPERYSPTSAQQ